MAIPLIPTIILIPSQIQAMPDQRVHADILGGDCG